MLPFPIRNLLNTQLILDSYPNQPNDRSDTARPVPNNNNFELEKTPSVFIGQYIPS